MVIKQTKEGEIRGEGRKRTELTISPCPGLVLPAFGCHILTPGFFPKVSPEGLSQRVGETQGQPHNPPSRSSA